MNISALPARALYVAGTHGDKIAKGMETCVVVPAAEDVAGHSLLVGPEEVLGTVELGEPEAVTIKQLAKRQEEHGLSHDERRAQWPSVRKFSLYPVIVVELFDKPRPLDESIYGSTRMIEKFDWSGVAMDSMELNEHTAKRLSILKVALAWTSDTLPGYAKEIDSLAPTLAAGCRSLAEKTEELAYSLDGMEIEKCDLAKESSNPLDVIDALVAALSQRPADLPRDLEKSWRELSDEASALQVKATWALKHYDEDFQGPEDGGGELSDADLRDAIYEEAAEACWQSEEESEGEIE